MPAKRPKKKPAAKNSLKTGDTPRQHGESARGGDDQSTDVQAGVMVPRFPIVGMGASAGGLEAFAKFFDVMPPRSAMAFILVQHLDPRHASVLDEILAKHTTMPVRKAANGMKVVPDNVYVIPPNADLAIKGGVLKVMKREAGRGMPIDRFFTSLAEDQGDNAVCVILSGTGTDGTLGLRAVKENGGLTIAQSPETARFDSMPRSAVPTGLVDFVLPIEAMPGKLVEYGRALIEFRTRMGDGVLDQQTLEQLPRIIAAVRRKTGHDFSEYRQKTIVRRIQRRMQVLHLESPAKYYERLRTDPGEPESLFREMLIGVTHFFRDPEAFEALRKLVIPALLKGRDREEELRIWVPACASGEESYSHAILLKEEMARLRVDFPVRLFAGDIDEDGLEEARRAIYPLGISQHVSKVLLDRYFQQQGDYYRVKKEIRDMCVFSTHNLIKNPPFSRLDLISCRNFLIYLETELQTRLMPLFHYALKPGGYLFLGPSESLGSAAALFRAVDKKHRIFQRKDGVHTPTFTFPITDPRLDRRAVKDAPPRGVVAAEPQVGRTLERMLLSRFAPPGVLVNEGGDILYISGRTGPYLEQPAGTPSSNVLSMARQGLRMELRAALHKCVKTREEVVYRNVLVKGENGPLHINLTVRPMQESSDSDLYMIIFDPAPEPAPAAEELPPRAAASEGVMQQLESELEATKARLQGTIEDLEASNEELKSANEELLSMNEELQSGNEEMQTTKEELQSLNEELETVNAELSNKVDELDRTYSDLQNLFQSTQIATIFVDKDLRIKKFTPAVTQLLRLIDADIGRPITDIATRFPDGDLAGEVQEVLRTLSSRRRELSIPAGATYTMQITPYRTIDNVIDGAVITFHDVTAVRQSAEAAEAAQNYAESIVEAAPTPLLLLDPELRVRTANRAFYETFKVRPGETEKRLVYDLGNAQWNSAELRSLLSKAIQPDGPESFTSFEVTHDFDRIGRRTVLVSARRLEPTEGGVLLLSIADITARKEAEEVLRGHRDRLDALVRERTAEVERASARLRVSERLAALGTLSAGLGHDMGNLLMPIRARLLSLERGSPTSSRDEDLRAVRECLEQIQHLSTGLRMLTAEPESGVSPPAVDVREWWRDVEVLFRNVLPRGVALRHEFDPGVAGVAIEKHHLSQAVFNLVQNAADAMSGAPRGSVTVRASPAGPGWVDVAVSDDGPGMTEEVRLHCLEPFFTTKTRGVSTGLGLGLVQGVVNRVKGQISVESEPGKGTTITLRLPSARVPAAPLATRSAAVTVLDARVRAYIEEVLTPLGFRHVESAPGDGELLWVSDYDKNAARRAAEFVKRGARAAVLIGPAKGPAKTGLYFAPPKASEIKRALKKAAAYVEAAGP